MKNKQMLLIILIVLGLFIGMPSAKAVTYKITNAGGKITYSNGLPAVTRYNATIDGTSSMVYCLDPGLQYAGNDDEWTVYATVDPSTGDPFDIAATYIYQRLLEMGMTDENDTNRVVGTTAYRLLAFLYRNRGCRNDSNCTNTRLELTRAWKAYAAGGSIWTTSDPSIKLGRELYQEAVNVVQSGKSYAQLVAEGILWAPQFDYELVNTQNNVNQIIYTYRITNTRNTPEKFSQYASGIEVLCANSSVKCSMNVASTTSTSIDINVIVDTTSWNNQSLGLVINLPYCDIKSSTFNLVILEKTTKKGDQHMVVAFPKSHTCPATPTSTYFPTYSLHVSGDKCELNGNTYTYYQTRDGSIIESSKKSWQKGTTPPEGVDASICPGESNNDKCTCDPATQTYSYQKYENGAWGSPVTWNVGSTAPAGVDTSKCPTTCIDLTEQSCKKPSESADGQYHCADGRVCDEDTHYRECECGAQEDFCTEHPEDPTCDEYYDKCINCSPVVTVPSDCSDLQEYNVNIYAGNYTAGISDISKKGTECNRNKANMVKSCVIGKTDAQNNSFEDTTIDATKNNPYCKVWCEESYDFGLPVAKRTQSGGYFTLSTSVTGTRTCYTSAADDSTKPIDEAKFKADLEAARKAVIDAYNTYAYWSARASASYTESTLEPKYLKKQDENGNLTDELICTADGGKEYSKELKYELYTYDGGKVTVDGTTTGTCDSSETVNNQSYGCVVSFSGTEAQISRTDKTSGSCTDAVSGSKSDDKTNADGVTYANEQKSNALNTLNQKITEFNNIIAKYNSCSGNMAGNRNGWENDIQFDPEITFSYNENYLNNTSDGKFVQTKVNKDETKSTYCTTDTGRTYNCLDSSKEYTVNGNNNVPASAQVTEKQFVCDASGCDYKDYTFSTAKWVKKEKTIEASYEPRTDFSTYTQYGTIQKDVTTGKYTLYTPLPDNAFPISLMTKTGVFPFTIKFNNIGQSNSDDDKLGRLIGENYGGDILTAFNKLSSEDKCNINGKKDSSYQSATTQSGYVCHYINNCDECKFTCEDGDCSFDDNCDGECAFTCENCLFDGKSTNYTFRTVSLNNLFPNDRQKGYNWDSNLKADITKKAIQTDGESIYKKAQYSYTLTPSSIQKIREYNKKAGSYTNTYVPSDYETISIDSNNSNEAVYCEQYNGTGANGELYNVKCRSKFLDILDELEGSGRAMASNIVRATRNSDAWELFEGYCTYGYGGKGTNGEDSCVHVGPSWRIRSVD